MKQTSAQTTPLPPVAKPNLADIEVQVARLRAATEAKQAYDYKNSHDNFGRHVMTILSTDPIDESNLGAVAFNYSLAASSKFNLPSNES